MTKEHDTVPTLRDAHLSVEIVEHVLLNALREVGVLFAIEGLARDVLVEFDVAVGDVGYDFGRHFRHLLAFFALEAVGHEPFAHKFFRKLLCGSPFSKRSV